MKKTYKKPTLCEVRIQLSQPLTTSGEVKKVESEEFNYGGGGNGVARGRCRSQWGDEENM